MDQVDWPAPPTSAPPPVPTHGPPGAAAAEQLDSSETHTNNVRRPPIPSFSIDDHEDTVAGAHQHQQRQSSSSHALSSPRHSRTPSRETPDLVDHNDATDAAAVTRDIPIRQLHISDGSHRSRYSHAGELDSAQQQDDQGPYSPHEQKRDSYYPLQPSLPLPTYASPVHTPSTDAQHMDDFNFGIDAPLQVPRTTHPRPNSAFTLGSELSPRGNTHSPRLSVGAIPSPSASPISYGHQLSANRRSPDIRPSSYVDLLNLPYNQQIAPAANIGNAQLRTSVGQNASLLDTKKTLDMYRANVKKTQDSPVQYEFALFMVQVAREAMASGPATDDHGLAPTEMLREARQILQKLADRSYPFAQYYLADGYASGLFNKDKPDYDRAFPLFIAASKHGHAESGYRAALCYEFGWGCRKDYAKAVQFFRAAASKNHPGAATRLGSACLRGDMGLQGKYREGVKWLKRASESADYQYNNAPYELGLLHETGYGDDIFKDEVYAVQLFTQAAELGHPMAALKLGEAYEHGYLRCPKDPALSVHYFNCAAQADIPEAMMNLCAWYMVGAEPVLDKDENEAYEWAKKAAEHGEFWNLISDVQLLIM
jgi:TPR repeat protein